MATMALAPPLSTTISIIVEIRLIRRLQSSVRLQTFFMFVRYICGGLVNRSGSIFFDEILFSSLFLLSPTSLPSLKNRFQVGHFKEDLLNHKLDEPVKKVGEGGSNNHSCHHRDKASD